MPRKTDRYLLLPFCVSAKVRNTSNHRSTRHTRLGLHAVSTPPAASHRVDHGCWPAHDQGDRSRRTGSIVSVPDDTVEVAVEQCEMVPAHEPIDDDTIGEPIGLDDIDTRVRWLLRSMRRRVSRGVRCQLVARTRRSGKTDSGAAQAPRVRITDIQTVSGLRRTAQPPGGYHTACARRAMWVGIVIMWRG